MGFILVSIQIWLHHMIIARNDQRRKVPVQGFSSTSRGSSGGFETAPAMTLEDTDELPPMAEDEPQVTAIAIPEDFGAGRDGVGNDDW